MPEIDEPQAREALARAGLDEARLLPAGASLSGALAAAADAHATLVLARLRDGARSPAQLAGLLGWLERCGAGLRVLDVGLDSGANTCTDVAALVAALEAMERGRGEELPPRGRPGISAGNPHLRERILALRAGGSSLQAIADELDADGVPTPRGGARWRPSSVQSALGYRRPRPPHPHLPPPPARPGSPAGAHPHPGRGEPPGRPRAHTRGAHAKGPR